jgi:hypothetical protein
MLKLSSIKRGKVTMKRYTALCLLPVIVFLTGASVWEGAASVSAGGDLPDEGYYAATNSFPRNTVVDVTNLETGKTIRVIVASGLETPGLLAILSRDAAQNIGLRPRSIGRIRMTQPQDPIAYSLFSEGLASSGDPDFDPRARIAAENPASPDSAGDSGSSTAGGFAEDRGSPGAGGSAEDSGPAGDGSLAAVPAAGPESPEPAAAESPVSPGSGEEITDVPDHYSPPADPGNEAGDPDLAWAAPEEEADVSFPPETPELAGTAPLRTPEAAEIPETSHAVLPSGPEPDHPSAELPEAGLGETELTLVPAGERPPEDRYVIAPDDFIPPVTGQNSAPDLPPSGSSPPEGPYIPEIPPVRQEFLFSVPLVTGLEQGKYYLQLGAYQRTEAVEAEITRIGTNYPLLVQNGGSPGNPVYRILLGPVNLGESGALLERFKKSGYGDAFIKQGG